MRKETREKNLGEKWFLEGLEETKGMRDRKEKKKRPKKRRGPAR
jgi:hypothetical protein